MVCKDPWDPRDMSNTRFGDGGHAKSSMGPKRSLERVFFSLKIPISEGDSVARSWPSASPKWL